MIIYIVMADSPALPYEFHPTKFYKGEGLCLYGASITGFLSREDAQKAISHKKAKTKKYMDKKGYKPEDYINHWKIVRVICE